MIYSHFYGIENSAVIGDYYDEHFMGFSEFFKDQIHCRGVIVDDNGRLVQQGFE